MPNQIFCLYHGSRSIHHYSSQHLCILNIARIAVQSILQKMQKILRHHLYRYLLFLKTFRYFFLYIFKIIEFRKNLAEKETQNFQKKRPEEISQVKILNLISLISYYMNFKHTNKSYMTL